MTVNRKGMDDMSASQNIPKWIYLTVLFVISLNNSMASSSSYYPSSFKKNFKQLNDQALKSTLRKVLTSAHLKRAGKRDILLKKCDHKQKGHCYRHKVVSYRNARQILFKKLHLAQDEHGTYVKDLYCGKEFSKGNKDFFKSTLSCEHTWPRSKFNKKESWAAQESDLHHLFPVDARANSIRSNYDFGEGGKAVSNCSLSRVGKRTFEPPEEHKGNVARALFYFSVRYNAPINSKQERILRIWHEEDPVDVEEQDRNQKIYQIQRIRNPFIDFPNMTERISNF